MAPTSLLVLSTFVQPAQAFAPQDGLFIGKEPTRILTTTAAHQHRLRQTEGWQSFVNGEGEGWMVRFDERTGTAHRAWGPGIDIGELTDPAAVEAHVRDFMGRNRLLVGVDNKDLELRNAGYMPKTDTWYVQFDRFENGVPVIGGGVTARMRYGKLILLGVDTYPQASGVGTAPELSATAAIQAAVEDGPAPQARHREPSTSLALLPQEGAFGLGFRLVWEVRTTTAEPVGIWVSHVDAFTGELVNVYNEVRFFEGQITGTHDLRTVDGDEDTSVLVGARVYGGNQAVYTDEDGFYSFSGDATTLTTDFVGDSIQVYNQQGSDSSGTFTAGEDYNWQLDSNSTNIAQLDSYVFLNQVKAWGETWAPEVRMVTNDLESLVNIQGSCNAYYDGNVNFYRESNQCNATARIADVNYHEWGHGFHYYSLQAGSFDGSVSEGLADAVSFFLTGDSVIAPYFMKNGSGIRDASPDRVYPDDITNEVHADGLIFAGAVWDLWDVLEEEMGPDEAYATVVTLFVNAIKGGPTIPDTYDEFIVADDDDGDLSNGTPNQCAIIEAFQRHGLGPMGSEGLIQLNHTPLQNQAPDTVVDVRAEINNLGSECTDTSIDEAEIHYSTDNGESWSSRPLTVSSASNAAAELVGQLPDFSSGTVVHYYIEGTDTEGNSNFSPSGGSINPHSFYVGSLIELYCENFEDADGGGYTHELVSGSNDEGADDWQWGTPAGKAGDPSQAYSGQKVWANDLGWDNYNGEYQNEKHNRLISTPIDVSEADGGELILQFRRWLNVEDGYYDEARVHVDGDAVWSNHATNSNIGDEHHQDETWALHTNVIRDEDGDGEITITWELESDQGLSMGGWNVDDVCVYLVPCTPEPEPEPETEPGPGATPASSVRAVSGSWESPEADVAVQAPHRRPQAALPLSF